jgi:hypothetical protein
MERKRAAMISNLPPQVPRDCTCVQEGCKKEYVTLNYRDGS